ncbi:hypothetical protein [Tenacibaculum sp. SDUM215027]|uniref:hypothetical protein n=1 Tax=Tenacibaculum sp. SDUM215027 TaxID=3422596 RepID=UPI003D3211EC
MKHTEEQIIKKAKKIIQDFRGEYYFEDCTDGALFKEKYKIGFGISEGEIIPCWTVFVKAIFDNIDLLFISDETGEPLYYHNFNMILFEIEKNKEGKYYKIEEE